MISRRAGQLWRVLAPLSLCSALLAPRFARAERPSVVVLGPKDTSSTQIHAELTALGFSVSLIEVPAPQTLADAQTAARDVDALARVYVVSAPGGVEVWWINQAGETSSLHVLRPEAPGSAADSILAVRVAELLRASVLEPEPPPHVANLTAEPGSPLDAPAKPVAEHPVMSAPRDGVLDQTPRREALHEEPPDVARPGSTDVFLFDAGVGASSSIGATRVTPIAGAGAFWKPAPRVGVGISALLPLTPVSVSEREGSASISSWELSVGPRFYPLLGGGAFQPMLGAGLGVLWFQVEGKRAGAAYTLSSEQLIVMAPHVELGARWTLSRSLALSSSLGASFALAKPVVQFAGRQVVTLGQPLVAWTLGVEYRAFSERSGD